MNRIFAVGFVAHLVLFVGQSHAVTGLGAGGSASAGSDAVQVEAAFSPDGGGEALVIKVIRSAKSTIRLAAYSFTSPVVVRALISARHRGVDVAAVVDYQNNVADDRSGRGRAALNLLTNVGIPTRTLSAYPIHHDKYIIVDGAHVQTGSFNYSESAARRNSENVLVVWNDPTIAAGYLRHWQSRFNQGINYRSSY